MDASALPCCLPRALHHLMSMMPVLMSNRRPRLKEGHLMSMTLALVSSLQLERERSHLMSMALALMSSLLRPSP